VTLRVALATSVFLTLVATAAAKGPVTATLCGASGCTAVRDLEPINPLWAPTELIDAPKAAPFYTLRASSPGPEGFDWSLTYVPSRRAVRIDNRGQAHPATYVTGRYWVSLSTGMTAVLSRLTARTDPYPASPTWTPRPARPEASDLRWAAVALVAALVVAAGIAIVVRRRPAVPVTS
jgi:hypothetical protein